MTPIEKLIELCRTGMPDVVDALTKAYAKEREEQAQERAKDAAEIYDLEGEIVKLNNDILKLELKLKEKVKS